MIDVIKDFWIKLRETTTTRVNDNLSGPFICAFILVFWEIPVHLIFSDADARIYKINQILESNLFLPYGLHIGRIALVFLAWMFWVFLFPVISPFLNRFRSWIIDTAQAWNKYEPYWIIKKKNDELMLQNSVLLSKSNEFDNYRKVLLERVKMNKDSFKHIIKLQEIAMKENVEFSDDEKAFIIEFWKTQDFSQIPANVNEEVRAFFKRENKFTFTLAFMDETGKMYERLKEVIK